MKFKRKIEGAMFVFLVGLVILALAGIYGDAEAKTERRARTAYQFQKANPCPVNGKKRGACPGYVIDHIVPLACNGPDSIDNMQWQTVADGKAKDKWERKNCAIWKGYKR